MKAELAVAGQEWADAMDEIKAVLVRIGATMAVVTRVSGEEVEVGTAFGAGVSNGHLHAALHATETQTGMLHQSMVEAGILIPAEDEKGEPALDSLPSLTPKPKSHKGH